MRPRDWFEVGARLIGVWICIEMVAEIRLIFEIKLGWLTPSNRFEIYFLRAVIDVIIATYLLFYGHHLAKLIYGPDPSPGGFAVGGSMTDTQ